MRPARVICVSLLMTCLLGWAQVTTAQVISSQTITAATTDCSVPTGCATFPVTGLVSFTVQLSGTFTATTVFESTADGTHWTSTLLIDRSTGLTASGATAAGQFGVSNVGITQFRVRASAYTSGTIAVVGVSGNGVASLPSSSGGGGVTSITGTANQVVASASTGAVTLSLPQSIATSSSPQFAGLSLGSRLVFSSTTPSVASGFGGGATIIGSAAGFQMTITGVAGGNAGTLTLPAATTGWACALNNMSQNVGTLNVVVTQSSTSATSAGVEGYSPFGDPYPFGTGDIVLGTCSAF